MPNKTDNPNLPFKHLVIAGAGTMGRGIALLAAAKGYDLFLYDLDKAQINSVITTIEQNLIRLEKRDYIAHEDIAPALAHIQPATDLDCLKTADLVIETVSENVNTKENFIKQAKDLLPPKAIIASNSSTISISDLGANSGRADKFIGLHFMNPAPLLPLVEIIRGIKTSDETVKKIEAFAKSLGKKFVEAQDFPAFIVHRILMPMINEAIYTLYEGVGTVQDIDTAMRHGTNHPMGPLELADFIGLDNCLSILEILYDQLHNKKYRPCPLLTQYVEKGWLGIKTGKGFYDYKDGVKQII